MSTPLAIPSLDTALDEYVALIKIQTDVTSSKSKLLPEDIPFHRSLDRKFRTELDLTSSRVLRLTNKLLRLAETLHSTDAKASGTRKTIDRDEEHGLRDEADVVDKFHSIVVDVVDPLLERVDHCLDIHTGRVKPVQENIIRSEPIAAQSGNIQKSARLPQHILHSVNLPKPQLAFLDAVDNSDGTAWKHRLKKKWHSSRSADDSINLYKSSAHPYREEISNITYPPTLFLSRPPVPPKSFESTTFTYVNTVDGLGLMLEKLRQSEEVAIDLEYHSYRSYYGFVCLMQISNREEDWVVDCLVPEVRASLEDLNEIFTNPNIIKVLHGAESDIPWLQQNFSLYIVNLFDTFHASRALDLPRHSLAFLLSAYCDFQADKRYQLADWRIRPLPDDMLHYARSDTHFLLFVYDKLREALLEKGKSRSSSPTELMEPGENLNIVNEAKDETRYIRKVLKDSEETSLNVFTRESYDAENGEGMRGWAGLIRKWNKRMLMIDGVPRSVYLAVHAWRDQVAREEDESPAYILSNQLLLNLLEKPIPENLSALYSSFPGVVPPLIRKKGNELLQLVQDAAANAQEMRIQSVALSKVQRANNQRVSAGDMDMINMEKPKHVVFSTQAIPVPDLWNSVRVLANGSQPLQRGETSIVAKKSSLFRGISDANASQNHWRPSVGHAKLSVRSSALFSNGAPAALPTPRGTVPDVKESNAGQVQKAIARIHEGILKREKKIVVVQQQPMKESISAKVLATSTIVSTKLVSGQPSPTVPDVGTSVATEALPTEMAFVPRNQRLPAQRDDDEIITVGQRKKKRKRVEGESTEEVRKKKAKGVHLQNSLIADSTEKDAEGALDESIMFDYGAAPNLLDDGGDVGEAKKKRKKDPNPDRGTKLDFRGFGPTPRRTNEPKSGNKSITFR